jgi:hypothetical protein
MGRFSVDDMTFDDFVDPAQEARDFEDGCYGDPRRCPHHPHVKTSSDDGMFDAPCGECEAAMDRAHHEQLEAEDAARYPDGFCAHQSLYDGPHCFTAAEAAREAEEADIPF